MKQNTYFCLYSREQKCFHIETMEEHINANIIIISNGRANEWMIVGGPFSDIEKAFNYSKNFEKELEKY